MALKIEKSEMSQPKENLRTRYPDIDVVIPTFNAMPLIDKCLRSIRTQEYPGKVNVILIDGGSIDGTIEVAKRYGCEIHVLKNVYSNGLTGARNLALEWCKGEYYWQIDSDNVILGARVLKQLVEPLMKNPLMNISSPMLKIHQKQSQIDKWLGEYEVYKIIENLKIEEYHNEVVVLEDMKYGISNASLIRTEMIRQVGGYDSDVRVLRRAREMNLSKGAVILNSFYYHFQGQSFFKWLKKLGRRVSLFGSMSADNMKQYFVTSSHDHTYRNDFRSLPLAYLGFSLKLIRDRKYYFYVGFLLLLGYLIIFIFHPLSFFRTYKRFL